MEIKSTVGVYRSLLFLGFIYGIVGCSSTKIAINVVRPPENPLSQRVETIALINGVGVVNAKTNQYMNGRVVAQFNGSTDYLVKNTFTQMESILNNGQYFNVFDTTLRFLPKNGGFTSNAIPVVLISRACEVLETDAIIAIEAYMANIDTDSEVRYSSPVDRNYGTVQVPYFDGEQNVDMRMLFRAYLCSSNVGEMDAQAEVETQVSMSASGSSPYEVSSRMRGGGNILIEATRKIAIDYSLQIGPRRETQSRRIYSKGNEQFVQAFELAGYGNWEGANDIWYLLATSNNKSIASKATYNLILGNEVLGNFSEAIQLANICIEKYEMKHVSSYKEVLKYREAEMKEVYRLFPSLIL
ncbi:MAG: hypothetical protein ACI85Q_001697 [Salibacteraceae bacterium]|jgi:hypothetical protein